MNPTSLTDCGSHAPSVTRFANGERRRRTEPRPSSRWSALTTSVLAGGVADRIDRTDIGQAVTDWVFGIGLLALVAAGELIFAVWPRNYDVATEVRDTNNRTRAR